MHQDLFSGLKIPLDLALRFLCPRCGAKLDGEIDAFQCVDRTCGGRYPVTGGIPILINEENSLFSIDSYVAGDPTFWKRSSLQERIIGMLPSLTKNVSARANFRNFRKLLHESADSPSVLVIGGSREGEGFAELLSDETISIAESDVAFGPRCSLISDCHDIPFEDETFDGVVIQAVLEHVIDPERCVQQIHRVLKNDGLVFADSPFMQQVHAGRYDFLRFSHMAHRRLFRDFAEIDSGISCGPGVALAWAYQYFLLSFVRSKALQSTVKLFARLTAFWLKYFDYFLKNRPGSLDAASGYYFIGRKTHERMSDKKILESYRGTQ